MELGYFGFFFSTNFSRIQATFHFVTRFPSEEESSWREFSTGIRAAAITVQYHFFYRKSVAKKVKNCLRKRGCL
jgi:hypothetical protein